MTYDLTLGEALAAWRVLIAYRYGMIAATDAYERHYRLVWK